MYTRFTPPLGFFGKTWRRDPARDPDTNPDIAAALTTTLEEQTLQSRIYRLRGRLQEVEEASFGESAALQGAKPPFLHYYRRHRRIARTLGLPRPISDRSRGEPRSLVPARAAVCETSFVSDEISSLLALGGSIVAGISHHRGSRAALCDGYRPWIDSSRCMSSLHVRFRFIYETTWCAC